MHTTTLRSGASSMRSRNVLIGAMRFAAPPKMPVPEHLLARVRAVERAAARVWWKSHDARPKSVMLIDVGVRPRG